MKYGTANSKCGPCGKKFSDESCLLRHLAIVHNGLEDFLTEDGSDETLES